MRDECNLPIEEFAGIALSPVIDIKQNAENLLILNRDLYEYKFEVDRKTVQITPLLQLKNDSKFFFLHRGHVIVDQGIFKKSSPFQQYVDEEKYCIEQEYHDVISGVPLNEECILLSHLPKAGQKPHLSIMSKLDKDLRYQLLSHQTHNVGPVKFLQCLRHNFSESNNDDDDEEGLLLVGVADNQIYALDMKEDPTTLRDG